MAKTPVTAEVLAQFGSGDQFHLVDPTNNARVIGEITKIEVRNTPGGSELYVEFEKAVTISEDEGSVKATDAHLYQAPLENREDIFVARQEDGFVEIANIGAEQIILLFKHDHRSCWVIREK